ncbi:MAG: DNA primase, partial [Clostridiaceae bacterium]|nr:DNA primase [Clostridiaceae bacterium]
YKVVKNKISPENFEDEENRNIAYNLFDRLENNKGMVPAELINLAGNETASIFTSLIQGECNFEDNLKAVMDIIRKIEIYKLDKRQKEILKILSSSSSEAAEKLKDELKSIMNSLNRKKSI